MDTLLDIVRSEVNQGINSIFYRIQNRAGIKHGDIAPEQEFKLDALKEELTETMLEVIKEELEHVNHN